MTTADFMIQPSGLQWGLHQREFLFPVLDGKVKLPHAGVDTTEIVKSSGLSILKVTVDAKNKILINFWSQTFRVSHRLL